jgi:hypothetical protein
MVGAVNQQHQEEVKGFDLVTEVREGFPETRVVLFRPED